MNKLAFLQGYIEKSSGEDKAMIEALQLINDNLLGGNKAWNAFVREEKDPKTILRVAREMGITKAPAKSKGEYVPLRSRTYDGEFREGYSR